MSWVRVEGAVWWEVGEKGERRWTAAVGVEGEKGGDSWRGKGERVEGRREKRRFREGKRERHRVTERERGRDTG